jgi:peptidoglycan/xylan/chitin deacetylase (PgdA/CDA1 family)
VSPRRSPGERVAAMLDVAWLRPLLRRAPAWRGVLVLNYHRVGDWTGSPFDHALWSATADGFAAQLALLARETDVVGPADVAELARRGRGRHVLITFDDGYRDNYEIALPLLRAHGLSATFFLATGFLDRPHVAWWDEIAWMTRNATRSLPGGAEAAGKRFTHEYKHMPAERKAAFLDAIAEQTGAGRCDASVAEGMWMSWDEARAMRDAGMAIGGHTVTHPVLGSLDEDEQRAEIAGCRERIAAELEEPMRWFSYPVGFPSSFDATTRAQLEAQGVELAFSFYGGWLRAGALDPFDVPRVNVGPSLTPARLHAMLRLPQLYARES